MNSEYPAMERKTATVTVPTTEEEPPSPFMQGGRDGRRRAEAEILSLLGKAGPLPLVAIRYSLPDFTYHVLHNARLAAKGKIRYVRVQAPKPKPGQFSVWHLKGQKVDHDAMRALYAPFLAKGTKPTSSKAKAPVPEKVEEPPPPAEEPEPRWRRVIPSAVVQAVLHYGITGQLSPPWCLYILTFWIHAEEDGTIKGNLISLGEKVIPGRRPNYYDMIAIMERLSLLAPKCRGRGRADDRRLTIPKEFEVGE